MKSIGFEQLTGDTCFHKLNPGLAADLATDHAPPPEGEIWVAAYVDDLSIASSNKDIYQWFIKLLGNRFPINASESGELDWILSMKVQRDREKGTLKLTQAAAIEKLYMGMGLDGPNARARVVTPMSTERLTKVSEPEFAKEDFDYLSILGSVLHINMLTRPDISFAVNSLTRHASCPGLAHAKALQRLVKYLYDTRHLGVTYYRDGQNCHPEVFESGMHPLTTPNNHMELFADSDYAQDYTRRSTSGMVVMLNGGPITWASKLQKSCAQSTAEAEVIAATEAVKEALHLQLMLRELGVLTGKPPIVLFEDNAACIAQGAELRNRRAAKHYQVRLRFLQDHVRQKNIRFVYCPTKAQLADGFTKPLERELFLDHRRRLLGN